MPTEEREASEESEDAEKDEYACRAIWRKLVNYIINNVANFC